MLDFLYNAGDFFTSAAFVAAALILLGAAPFIGHRLGWTAEHLDRGNYVLSAERNLASFAALIFAFSLIQAQNNYKQAEQLVAKEAGRIDFLDRQLSRYGDAQVAEIRAQLRAYAESVVRDEWPALQAGHGSARAEAAFTPLATAIFAISPEPGRQTAIYNDLLRSLDELSESRKERIAAASLQLTPEIWCFAAVILLLAAGLGLLVPPRSVHAVTILATGCGIALVAALVFCVDKPFKGSIVVAPAAIEQALADMKARS